MRSSSPGADWFRRALACRLDLLPAGDFTIIWVDVPLESDGAAPFVQVTRTRDAMVIEVSTNRFLDDACRLSDDDEFRLLELGFHLPVGDRPHFWLVGTPVDAARFGDLAACVLATVHGVTDVRTIAYDSGPIRDTSRSPLLAAPVSLLQHVGSLTVWADYDDAGNLEINGQCLGGRAGVGAFEYFLTVPVAAFPSIRAALEAPADVDVRALLTAYAPVVARTGERCWFDDHAIGYEQRSHVQH